MSKFLFFFLIHSVGHISLLVQRNMEKKGPLAKSNLYGIPDQFYPFDGGDFAVLIN